MTPEPPTDREIDEAYRYVVWMDLRNSILDALVPPYRRLRKRLALVESERSMLLENNARLVDEYNRLTDAHTNLMLDRSSEATTEPLTVEILRMAAERMFDAPLRRDEYEDGPAMRRALGIEKETER